MLVKSLAAVAVLALSAGSAAAATVKMAASMTISSIGGSNGAGLSVGDTIDFEILLDNGGGLESNSWSNSHIVSATAKSGSYMATFLSPYSNNTPIFETNGLGDVIIANWFDAFDNPNSDFDTLGIGVTAANNAMISSDGSIYYWVGGLGGSIRWEASVVPVPLPAGLTLLLGALGGLALVRRRTAA